MKTSLLIALGALAAPLPGAVAADGARADGPRATPLEEVVMYGVDVDTFELLRYDFGRDEIRRVGILRDQDGRVVSDVEGLALIPHGSAKGLYATANYFLTRPSRLLKINGLDGSAQVYETEIGFDKVEGLVAAVDPASSDWCLLAAARDPATRIIRIDPRSGAGQVVLETVNRYVGLAAAADGTVYGTTKNMAELWKIDLGTGAETRVGPLQSMARDYRTCEALEFAFGDPEARVRVPAAGGRTVPDSWTMDGALVGLADVENALLIINPRDGRTVEWRCAFRTVNCEGLAFTTRGGDPFDTAATGD